MAKPERSVVMPIIIINIVMFILQLMFSGIIVPAFVLLQGDAFSRPWTLLTSMFLHADGMHILFNMYVLLIFGPIVEQRIGPKRFLWIYLTCGIAASFVSSFFYTAALGASGAILGIMGLLIVLMPNLRVLFFFFIPMPLWVAGIVIAAIDIFGLFVPSGIANVAHLVGMACGLAYGLNLKKKKRSFDRRFEKKGHLSDDDVEDFIKSGRI